MKNQKQLTAFSLELTEKTQTSKVQRRTLELKNADVDKFLGGVGGVGYTENKYQIKIIISHEL